MLMQIAERAQPAWRILQRLILSNGLVRPQAGSPSSIQVDDVPAAQAHK